MSYLGMELAFHKGEIVFDNKKLTILDKTVLDFLSYVDTKYVIVSGYVSILFGRSRNTEDIDLFIETQTLDRFSHFFNKIIGSKKYFCINASDSTDAYQILTSDKSSIRFAEVDTMEPNFEIKFPQNELNLYSLENPVTVKLNSKYSIKIGPMELQLAYKLYLGSDKDYMDAAHLYIIFKDHIDKKKLSSFIKRLGIKESIVKETFGETL